MEKRKNTGSRVLSLLLAIALFLPLWPVGASAAGAAVNIPASSSPNNVTNPALIAVGQKFDLEINTQGTDGLLMGGVTVTITSTGDMSGPNSGTTSLGYPGETLDSVYTRFTKSNRYERICVTRWLRMKNLQNRHDLSDAQWEKIEPVIKARLGNWGGSNANDNRVFVNACLWNVRTGAPWRDLPPQYGKFNAVHRRYKRWCECHHWDFILAELIDDPDYEWLMIDASHCKVHPHAAGAIGGNQAMGCTKGGSTPKFTLRWMQMVCRSELLSQKVQEQIANLVLR